MWRGLQSVLTAQCCHQEPGASVGTCFPSAGREVPWSVSHAPGMGQAPESPGLEAALTRGFLEGQWGGSPQTQGWVGWGEEEAVSPTSFCHFEDVPSGREAGPTSGCGVAAKFKPFSLSASGGRALI